MWITCPVGGDRSSEGFAVCTTKKCSDACSRRDGSPQVTTRPPVLPRSQVGEDVPLTYGLLKSCLETSFNQAIAPLRSELRAVGQMTTANTESIGHLEQRVSKLELKSPVLDHGEMLRRQRCAELRLQSSY
jgi:hypothetical protein